MPIETTVVRRESIRHSPHSNTEFNTERLPGPKSIQGMELRYRGERPAGLVGGRPIQALAGFSLLGILYALAWHSLPASVRWLWQKLQETEGMPVVGSMAGGLLAILLSFVLVFVPKEIRRGLLMFTLPAVIISWGSWAGRSLELNLMFVVVALFVGVSWKESVVAFHRSWLTADPRMSTQDALLWKIGVGSGWLLPSSHDLGQTIERYLFSQPPEGAPGVWIPPSSRSVRVMIPALFCGSLFAVAVGAGGGANSAVSMIVASVLSVIVVIAFSVWVAGEAAWLSRDCETRLQNDQRTPFQRHSDRVRSSNHSSLDVVTGAPITEAAHLFLGAEPWQKFPILLHEPMLYEHVHISGRTGSGKTSMGLMQMLIQLIRGHCTENGGWSDTAPMIIIDLKGDPTLFQTARAEARARGQKFRFFTLEPGRASFYFNPFIGFKTSTLTVPQLVQLNLDALDLYHGTGYGRGYYSQRSRFLLSQALRNPAGVDSFQDLYARLQTLYAQHPDDFRDAFELLSVIESLTYYDQLVTTAVQESGDETIRMDRVLEDREVVYFWLPSVKESVSVAQVGKLVLFNLRTAAHEREVAGKEKRQAYLLIDEFQRLAGENFQQILQQARSTGIAAILANQALADLKTPDWDLTPTIRTNTRVKMFFSITEPEEIETFRELSGEELQTFGLNDVEEIRLRMSTKELASLSDHPKRLLLQISSGSGYSQFGGLPIPLETDWPISKELSDKRAAMPWPTSPTIVRRPPIPKPQKPAPATSQSLNSSPAAPIVSLVQPAAAPSTKAVPQTPGLSVPAVSTARPPAVGVPQPGKSKKPKPTPRPKPAPSPAVKQAFAQKIQVLMNP